MKPKSSKLLLAILAFLLLAWFVPCIIFQISRPQLKWDWSKIDTNKIAFPKDFIWGVATAAHQVEGYNTNNQWYLWETAVDEKGNPRIAGGQKAGIACDHWNRYSQDIGLMKELGLRSYRFSVEWSRIEPAEGVFDTLAIKHYQDVCDSLIANGIVPMVTLHHFTNPIWFEKKGAFEKMENVADFVKFTEVVYLALKDRVTFWCTINEPAVYVVEGYFHGANPPGKKDPKLAAVVLRNILEAHVQAYWKIKSLPGGNQAKVGVVKNLTQNDPYRKWHLGDWIFANLIDGVFNATTLDFLRTGKFRFNMPTMATLTDENPKAKGTLDFIGLNYYSHYNYKFSFNLDQAFQAKLLPGEIKTDMDYASYPEGLYRAIKTVSQFRVPIYITENGVADAKDDRRALFISQYLYTVSKAIADGFDIRGYYYWTLIDNFEWSLGYDMKFGLYSVDMNTQVRTLKEGARRYQEIIRQTR
ncbi:MAG: glycoside hydrolase family 1 protein [Bacteroidia bacterium]|nr:glycoside hydrolase family 1 protein [Bacteroidia bacterium]